MGGKLTAPFFLGGFVGLCAPENVCLGDRSLATKRPVTPGSDMNSDDPKSHPGGSNPMYRGRDQTPPPVAQPSTPRFDQPPTSGYGAVSQAVASQPASSQQAKSIPPPSAPVDPYVGTTIDGRY